MIPQHTIQEITDKLDIVDVISEFIRLKKRGVNYIGNCPFHNEKTPSFTVSPTKEIFKCFGCGKSGNTIGFLMEHEKFSYVEALKWLAARYHITVEEEYVSDEKLKQQKEAESLYIINQFAAGYFQDELMHSEEGRNVALSYLTHRGFSKQTIEQFNIGYCPSNGKSFVTHAINKQYNKELLIKSGLITERNGELYDNYRNRIIFPIHAISGKIIGFGARVIGNADKAPKYINTPENEIYVKNKILYGLYQARASISKLNECLLVEGYTDVTSLQQAGIENVVASGGTSLTVAQLKLIQKYTPNLTILYDGDEAGIKAALRGLDLALEEGLNVKVVLIPDKEDPDSLVNKKGKEAFSDFIHETKKDFILFQLEVLLKDAGNDITKKNEAVNHIAQSLSRINKPEDFIKQQEFARKCAEIIKIDEAAFITLINKYKRDALNKMTAPAIPQRVPDPVSGPSESLITDDEDVQHEKNMLKVLLQYGNLPWNEHTLTAQHIYEELEDFDFNDPVHLKLYTLYFDLLAEGKQPEQKSFLYINDDEIKKLVTDLTIEPYELSDRWDEKLDNAKAPEPDLFKQDVFKSLCFFKLRKIKKMFIQNQQEMEQTKDLNRQMNLMKVHSRLKQFEMEITRDLGTVIFK